MSETYNTSDMQELFKATAAAGDTEKGRELRQAFAQAISVPVLQEIRLQSVARELFSEDVLAPGAQAG